MLVAFACLLVAACLGGTADEDRDRAFPGSLRLVATLGVADGEGVLHRVHSIANGRDGSIWVFESEAEIVRFSPEGTFLGRVTRKGNGPGELPQLTAGHVDPYSGVVGMYSRGRYVLTDTSFVEIARFQFPLRPPAINPSLIVEPGGAAIWSFRPLRADTVRGRGALVSAVTGVFALVRQTDSGADTVATVYGRERLHPAGGGSSSLPYSGEAVLVPADTLGVLTASGHTDPGVTLHAYPDGDVLYRYEHPFPRPVVTKEKRSEAAERLSRISGTKIGAQDIPELTSGYVRAAVFDPLSQRVFVCRVVEADAIEATVDVYGLRGAYFGTATWSSCPIHVDRQGRFYLQRISELGVEFIDIYVLEDVPRSAAA